jgi:hypothetical protein
MSSCEGNVINRSVFLCNLNDEAVGAACAGVGTFQHGPAHAHHTGELESFLMTIDVPFTSCTPEPRGLRSRTVPKMFTELLSLQKAHQGGFRRIAWNIRYGSCKLILKECVYDRTT